MFKVRAMAGTQTSAPAAALAISRLWSSSLPACHAKRVTMQEMQRQPRVHPAHLESTRDQEHPPARCVPWERSPTLQHLPSAQHAPTARTHPGQARRYARHVPGGSINRSSSLPLASPVHPERLQAQRALRCAVRAVPGRMQPTTSPCFVWRARLERVRVLQEALRARTALLEQPIRVLDCWTQVVRHVVPGFTPRKALHCARPAPWEHLHPTMALPASALRARRGTTRTRLGPRNARSVLRANLAAARM